MMWRWKFMENFCYLFQVLQANIQQAECEDVLWRYGGLSRAKCVNQALLDSGEMNELGEATGYQEAPFPLLPTWTKDAVIDSVYEKGSQGTK